MSTKPKTFVKFWGSAETCLSGGTGSALFSLLSLMRNSTENCDLVRSNELKKCLPKPCFGGSGVVSGKVCSGGSFCVASRSLWTGKQNAQKSKQFPSRILRLGLFAWGASGSSKTAPWKRWFSKGIALNTHQKSKLKKRGSGNTISSDFLKHSSNLGGQGVDLWRHFEGVFGAPLEQNCSKT